MKDETTARVTTVTSCSCHIAVSCPTRENINMYQRTKFCPQSSSNLNPTGREVCPRKTQKGIFPSAFLIYEVNACIAIFLV